MMALIYRKWGRMNYKKKRRIKRFTSISLKLEGRTILELSHKSNRFCSLISSMVSHKAKKRQLTKTT
jgi:hypothetical protein